MPAIKDCQAAAQARDAEFAKEVLEIADQSDRKTALLPDSIRRAMASYLEPESDPGKPWETWL